MQTLRLFSSIYLCVLVFAGCFVESDEAALPAGEEILVSSVWEQDASRDAYTGVWVESAVHKRTFVFNADKTYTKDIEGGCCRQEGTWRLTDENEELIITFLDPVRGTVDFGYKVRTLNRDTLQIAWTGRHGYVTERWLPLVE